MCVLFPTSDVVLMGIGSNGMGMMLALARGRARTYQVS